MSLEGVRARVTIEAVLGAESDRFYRLVADSFGNCILEAGSPFVPLTSAGGLIAFSTQESFGGMGANLEFAMGPIAYALQDLVKPNDLVTVEIASANADDGWNLAHMGLVSSIRATGQSSPNSIRASLSIKSEGLQKLFNQSIFNWQGVMAMGDDRVLGRETFDAYRELSKDGITKSPSQIIQALVRIGVSNSVKALVHKKRIAPGDLFDFSNDWGSLYDAGNWPLMAGILLQEWSGTLWSLLQSVAETDIHELFWSIRRVVAEDKPVLVHRPRPFPDGGMEGDQAWLALGKRDLHVFGKNGAPGSIGYMSEVSDAGRTNSFHWGQVGFTDSGGSQMGKLILGWWCDKRGIAKYGFAPRQVSIGILPKGDENWLDLVDKILRRVAYQEAPLYLMPNQSRGFGCFLPGVHIGQAMEDWTDGKVTTGYISSVSQSYHSTPQGIQVGATLGVSRCLRGVSFSDYPKAAAALVDLEHVEYLGKDHPSLVARDGARALSDGSVASATGIRWADQIKAAAAKRGVPSWFLAKLFQKESTFGTDPRMNTENSAGALGPMQLLPVAITDANGLGYRTPAGAPATMDDRRNVTISLDIAAFMVAKRYQAGILGAGCVESNPNHWRYVADAYYRGAAAAAASGSAAAWGDSGLLNYGKTLDVVQTKFAFGGIG